NLSQSPKPLTVDDATQRNASARFRGARRGAVAVTAARVFTKLYPPDKSPKFGSLTFRGGAKRPEKERRMSTHDPKSETPDSVPQGGRPRRRFTYVVAALGTGVLLGGFAGSSAGEELVRRMLAHVPGLAASAALFEGPGFGEGLAADWSSGLYDGAIEA